MSRKEMTKTLARWLIDTADGEAYRAGRLTGWKHPKVDGKVLHVLGGWQNLKEQAKMLEQDPKLGKTGKIRFGWRDMGNDITCIDYDISIIPLLCQRERIPDPREVQLSYISDVECWRTQVEACPWILPYYDHLLERLHAGKEVKDIDLTDELFFKGLNAVVMQKVFVWERVFSAGVFGESKTFKNAGYRKRIFHILKDYSPYYEEDMSEDELFAAHEIHSYTQALEWKGPLQYLIDGVNVVDTSKLQYGAVLNSQTMEHALPCTLAGCKKIMTIENKANYENMSYVDDTLYIYCHGFFSPREMRFLQKITELAEPGCVFYHWGDMDYGGIRIFQFIKKNLFPMLLPYKMTANDFEQAKNAGAGISLEAEKAQKLKGMDAGILEELKEKILETNLTIEQEKLLALDLGGQAIAVDGGFTL